MMMMIRRRCKGKKRMQDDVRRWHLKQICYLSGVACRKELVHSFETATLEVALPAIQDGQQAESITFELED